ncbi:MAG: hypothetical protein KDB27_03440, partial [Planctomycetales bacterium]|nr:hypothetical protein [Planctomycetales bacterium]
MATTKTYFEEVEISERVSKIAGKTRPRRESRSPQIAKLSVRASEVTIRGPVRPGGNLSSTKMNVVKGSSRRDTTVAERDLDSTTCCSHIDGP